MSDLISRSELIKFFEAHMRTAEDFREIIINIIPTIKNQPTAYDIGKVVDELEKLADASSDHMYESYFDGKEDGIREAIEIVKQGVISDDVCEWRCDMYGRWHTECHTLADN